MLATLTRGASTTPVLLQCRGDVPAIEARWLARPPAHPRQRRGSLPVTPHCRVIYVRRWQSASLLDSNQDLPLPVVDLDEPPRRKLPFVDWHEGARCRTIPNPDAIFFGAEPGERPTLKRSDVARAQRICRTCPVVRECLTHALTKPEIYGIWGGTSGRKRERLWVLIEAGASVEQVVDSCLA